MGDVTLSLGITRGPNGPRSRIIAVLSFGVIWLAAGALAQLGGAQPAPQILEQHAEFSLNPPASLAEQVQAADVVIHARVQSAVVKGKQATPEAAHEARHLPFGRAPQVYTEYSVGILEVLKHPASPMPTMGAAHARVVQLAGELRWREYLIRANAGSPTLEPQGEYVLVLKWSEVLGSYLVGPDGIYEIVSEHVEPKGRIAAAQAQRSRSVKAFMEAVRAAAR